MYHPNIFYIMGILHLVIAKDDPLLVKTQQGSLIGTELTNEVNNQTFYGFLNIPYAQKPVGEKRFKEPEEPLPWEGIRDAKEEGNQCLSMNPMFQTVEGDEDCLILNVYTPKPPSELQSSPRAVLVWIHGGAFHMGSSSSLNYGPEFLIMQDVILVTINYRLNVFGFLSLQNEEIPGNAGLKDQVMALKWIKANIKSFGGDPQNITIFGESAGGASVHYLILSESSKGLFQKAIIQSGTALSPWASTNLTVDIAKKLGKVFDCDTVNLSELLLCLRGVDARELAKYQYNVVTPTVSEPLAVKVFLPCIEPKESPNPFLTEEPRELLRLGHFSDVPLIIGTVKKETLFLSKGGLIPENLVKTIYAAVNKNPALILGMKLGDVPSSLWKVVGDEIIKFYYQGLPVSENTILNTINVTTDINFLLDTNDVVSYHSSRKMSPVFHYYFNIDTPYGRMTELLDVPLKGPSHGDDIGYLFFMQMLPQDINPRNPGYKAMIKITKLWTNFAKFGNPTPDSEFNIEWKPATTHAKYYLNIDEELSVEQDVEKERMDFWENLRLRENLNNF